MTRFLKAAVVVLLCMRAAAPPASADVPLVKAIDIRSLSPQEADESLRLRLRGTFIFHDHNNAVFLQDETAGALFWYKGDPGLKPGDIVEVEGTTRSGLYVPGLDFVSFRVVDHGLVPEPIEAGYDDLISGRYHYQWVSIEGIVRSVSINDQEKSIIRLAMGSRIVEIHVRDYPGAVTLVDHKIRVTGLAAGGINDRYQLIQPYVWPHGPDGIEILSRPGDPAELPAVSADRLLTFRPSARSGHRVRVAGTVLASFADGRVYIRDGENPLSLKLTRAELLQPGDVIEALGFPEIENFSAALVDASLIQRLPGAPPEPIHTWKETVVRGSLNHELVSFTGPVADSFRTEKGASIVIRAGTHALRVLTPPLAELPAPGSVLRVTGICDVESSRPVNYLSRPESIAVHVRSAADVAVLDAPPWWTTGRLTAALFILAGIVCISALWIILLRRQVDKQTAALRDRIENEAMLMERQRIAREFHDTLEQDLAGLSLQLGAAAARGTPEPSRGLLDTARHLVSRIQTETRNLLSDLRTPADQALDLPSALRLLAEKHPGTLGPSVELYAEPPLPPLPPRTVHHLRMIAQESVTNAIKHSAASLISIVLRQNGDNLVLAVADNGRGFDTESETWEKPGHFGCMGIRERSRKLGAEVAWHSTPGGGTTVNVTLPLSHP